MRTVDRIVAGRDTEFDAVQNMMLDHVDFEAAVWVKPADAMKTGKAYRVPVSDQALEVLRAVRTDVRGAGQVFPGSRLPVELQGLGGATRTSSRFSQAR